MDDFSAKAKAPNAFGLLGGSVNRIQPKKRMLSSMTPTLVLRNGKPYFTVVAPGGPTIITRVFQVITNVIDYGMNIKDAVTALRFHHQWPGEEIEYEPNAIPKDAIMIDKGGLLQGAADPRNGDFAIGY